VFYHLFAIIVGMKTKNVSYVVAVSGGVDSVVLLDILANRLPGERLTVAHFDHGIRPDSSDDRRFVQNLARKYQLAFTFDEGKLGADASEATARQARYDFLKSIKQTVGADYIATAHHEDDVFETAILNMLRGTGRKGLSSLKSHGVMYRPLLSTPKANIKAYAKKQGLEWREDSTNESDDYLRNYIRHHIMTRFDDDARQKLRQILQSAHETNIEIDGLLANQLHLQPSGDTLDRQWFIMLPHGVAREIVAAWLRRLGINSFDRQLLERIVVAAKTFAPGKKVDINRRYILQVDAEQLMVKPRNS